MKRPICFLSFFALLLSLCACVDDKVTTDPSAVLAFSCDTLSFDTMFTNVPSRTLSFTVYNRNRRALVISSVRLGRGSESYFRYNLDGRVPPDNKTLENIEIGANDSLFVFVEITADSSKIDVPLFYIDSMIFVTNGVTQDVKLVNYGQDAIILRDAEIGSNTTFNAQRPYLIFGNLHVADNATLTLEAGTRLFFHSKANLVVDGNLVAKGTAEKPVLMRTDRFDRMPDEDKTPYEYMPGQWGGIYLQNAHGTHIIDHAQIRNCDIGVVLVGTSIAQPTLTLTNSVLHSMTQYGLYTQNAKVEMANCELSNCGTSCLYQLGGELRMAHTTIANYYTWGSREDVALVVANYALDGNLLYIFPVQSTVIENSIVFGSQSSEISLLRDTITDATFNVLISNSLLKKRKQNEPFYHDNLWANSQNPDASGTYHSDTVFVNTTRRDGGYYNFQLDQQSQARGRANSSVAQRYPTDLLDHNRLADGSPDLGAYEK